MVILKGLFFAFLLSACTPTGRGELTPSLTPTVEVVVRNGAWADARVYWFAQGGQPVRILTVPSFTTASRTLRPLSHNMGFLVTFLAEARTWTSPEVYPVGAWECVMVDVGQALYLTNVYRCI